MGGLFRRFVIPLFRTHGKTLALNALRTGMDVAEDVQGSGRVGQSDLAWVNGKSGKQS